MTCPVCHGPVKVPPNALPVDVLCAPEHPWRPDPQIPGAVLHEQARLVPYTARRCARCPRVFYAPEEAK